MEFICIYNRSLHDWKILASDLIRDLHFKIGLLATPCMQWSTEITHSVLLRSVILSAYFIWALALLDFIARTTLRPTNTIQLPSFTPLIPRFDLKSLHSTHSAPFACIDTPSHRLFLWLTDLTTRRQQLISTGRMAQIKISRVSNNKMKLLKSSSTRRLLQSRIIGRSSKQKESAGSPALP